MTGWDQATTTLRPTTAYKALEYFISNRSGKPPSSNVPTVEERTEP